MRPLNKSCSSLFPTLPVHTGARIMLLLRSIAVTIHTYSLLIPRTLTSPPLCLAGRGIANPLFL